MFFAMDPIGLLPIFYGLTEGCDLKLRRKIILQSVITALAVAIGFMVAGRVIFKLLGITMADFMIAGGVILFCLAMLELMVGNKPKQAIASDIGAVPIGTPLVVGPAVLTMGLMLSAEHGFVPTLLAITFNIMIVGIVFLSADCLMRVIGRDGAKALSKVLALLLAAIGVMLVRRGVTQIITGN